MMNLKELIGREVLVFDGAMGTQLQARGLPAGGCPELWNLERPDAIQAIHADYVDAGAQILETNTFGALPCRLEHYGLQHLTRELNVAAVRIARAAAAGRAMVSASMGPTGLLIEPLGETTFQAAYDNYAAQADALHAAQPDLIIIETIADLNEMRAALMACKDRAPGIPVLAQMTIDPGGRAFTGTDPETAVVVLQALGADMVGLNCSVGPDLMIEAVKQMARVARVPISVQPNAGLPLLQPDGSTTFPTGPEAFAAYMPRLVAAGAGLVGGCCGTTPEHIRRVRAAVQGLTPGKPGPLAGVTALASRTRSLFLTERNLPVVIGERLNPTGRKLLSKDIAEGRFQRVRDEAKAQAAAGAHMLDVNVGVPGIDEPAAMYRAVTVVQEVTDLPLCIDAPGAEILAAGLRAYVGKPLLNSFSGEAERLEQVLPMAKRWGAAVIGLCLDEKGIQPGARQRFQIAQRLVDEALKAGIHRSDIVIDVLALPAGAEQAAARETLRAIRMVKEELGVATSLGVSNVSFGLPNRGWLNSQFLTMALTAGLDMAIVNPGEERMMDAIRTTRLFLNRDLDAREFVATLGKRTLVHTLEEAAKKLNAAPAAERPAAGGAADPAAAAVAPTLEPKAGPALTGLRAELWRCILEGDKDNILAHVETGLQQGTGPLEMLNEALIPAIEEVGRLFGDGTYFLPQLMLSATAMKKAFVRLKPELEKLKSGEATVGTIVLATVQGDIHDIGKNICAVLLENYGFKVIDLGRDVKNEEVVRRALEEKADLVGLSALMTTTMPQMRKVIHLFREQGHSVPVLIGGAATSRRYAAEIGASGHGRDAQEAVQVALQVLEAIKQVQA